MRNALLILGGVAVALTIVLWWSWQRAGADRSLQPLAAAPAGTSPASAQPSPDAAELTRAEQRGNSEPTAALSDIEQADPQRRALEILVLVQLGRVGHARALADRFYRDFPGSPEIPQIERVTGYHPRPYAPHTSPSN